MRQLQPTLRRRLQCAKVTIGLQLDARRRGVWCRTAAQLTCQLEQAPCLSGNRIAGGDQLHIGAEQ